MMGETPGPPVDQVRVPPHNFEAEQALLGSILLSNRAFEKVSEFLRAEHFADPVHGRIFATCGKLIERGQIANPVTLKSYFEGDGGLDEIGGTPYLAQLANAVVSVVNADDYGRLVYDLHLRRELIGFGIDVVNDAFEASVDTSAIQQISDAEGKLFNLATSGKAEGGPKTFNDFLLSAIDQAGMAHKRQGKLSGVPTGLRDLDKKLGGLHPSDLLIIAGHPGMGKTSIATNIAFNAAQAYREEVDISGAKQVVDGAIGVFFSLEMSGEQLVTRILSCVNDPGFARAGLTLFVTAPSCVHVSGL
jgi:replicative DNA helicase